MRSGDENTSFLEGASAENQTKPSLPEQDTSKGARPKVRNPKEAKRRRFVMKQAKNISKPQLLESVSETEEAQALLQKGEGAGDGGATGKRCFGVRSYVHTFYEAMALDNQHFYQDRGMADFRQLMPAKKRRKRQICWRATIVSGSMILLLGLVAILVGFLVPRRPEVVGGQEDIAIINRADLAFNQDLDVCKVVGIVLFCGGGCMMAGVLLGLTLVSRSDSRSAAEDELSPEEIPMVRDDGPEDVPLPIQSASDVKVPVTEEVTAVQPKRVDCEEVVMTNAGLCKVPP